MTISLDPIARMKRSEGLLQYEAEEKRHAERMSEFETLYAQLRLPTAKMLVSALPMDFESIDSLIFRACRGNGVAGTGLIRKMLRWNDRGLLSPNRIKQVARSVGIPERLVEPLIPTSINGVDVRFNDHGLKARHVSPDGTKVCPLCVKEDGYGRSYWQLRVFSVCEVHGCYLTNMCHACHAPLSPGRLSYGACRCGSSIGDGPMQRASAGAQALACFIASRFKRVIPDGLGHDSTCPPSLLNPLTLAEILDVVAILGMAERDANITLMRKLDWPVDCSRGLQKFERAAGALSNWPHGFYARLRALRLYQPWVDSSWEVTKSLDPFIRIATLNLLPGASALILDAVAAFASDGREWNEHRHRVASEGLAWQA